MKLPPAGYQGGEILGSSCQEFACDRGRKTLGSVSQEAAGNYGCKILGAVSRELANSAASPVPCTWWRRSRIYAAGRWPILGVASGAAGSRNLAAGSLCASSW